MTRWKKFLPLLLVLTLVLLPTAPAAAAGDDTVTILYTNDIHTYIDNHVGEGNENALSYSRIAALKDSLENTVLVDAGDHIQGTAYGSMDRGETILRLMNAAGYDAATLGNHEFDYDMERCMALIEAADFPYTSCNFRHLSGDVPGETVLPPYALVERGETILAFVGITTPESIRSSTPAYFQDENGSFIYSIDGGEDGEELYTSVQSAIDAAREAGADYVIALGHLGVDLSSVPWTSREVIANTSGLDAFIDGHSHTTLEMETVTDADGEPVVLTQTGSYLQTVGQMTISPDGTISSRLLRAEDLAHLSPDPELRAIEDAWVSEIDARLGETIGYAQVTLDNYDADGTRLVRKQSTNTGDFAADALYALFDGMGMEVDAAIMNGGGIRNTALSGELSYLSCKQIHSFGNVACLLEVSGQQLLDALEWGVSEATPDGAVENGGFLHVSGLRYTVDLSIPSTVQRDENDIWTGGPTGAYRVTEVELLDRESGEYRPLDLNGRYRLAGYNYTLRNLGDGFAMFAGAVNVLDYVAEDYMVLADYIRSFPVDETSGLPTIAEGMGYDSIYGSGRISIRGAVVTEPEPGPEPEPQPEPEPEPEDSFLRYEVQPGDSLWKISFDHYGRGAEWRIIYEANRDSIAVPGIIQPGQLLLIPARDASAA